MCRVFFLSKGLQCLTVSVCNCVHTGPTRHTKAVHSLEHTVITGHVHGSHARDTSHGPRATPTRHGLRSASALTVATIATSLF